MLAGKFINTPFEDTRVLEYLKDLADLWVILHKEDKGYNKINLIKAVREHSKNVIPDGFSLRECKDIVELIVDNYREIE